MHAKPLPLRARVKLRSSRRDLAIDQIASVQIRQSTTSALLVRCSLVSFYTSKISASKNEGRSNCSDVIALWTPE